MTDPTDQDSTTIPSNPLVGVDETQIPTRLMVLGMAHRDGTVLANEVYQVGELCGLSSDQVRSCLRRLVSEGLFTRDGEGKEAVFTATDEGSATLSSRMQRHRGAYAQDAAGRGWDRKWRMVAFAIPESLRAARDEFRDRLLGFGAAAIHNGLYVSPHQWDTDVDREIERLGLGSYVTLATTDDLCVAGVTDPRQLAANLWPLDEVAARYRQFIDAYVDVPGELEELNRRRERIADVDFLPGALNLAISFSDCSEFDPLLPPELLPKPWPGREARNILVRCRKLGGISREDKTGPALFHVFDEAITAF